MKKDNETKVKRIPVALEDDVDFLIADYKHAKKTGRDTRLFLNIRVEIIADKKDSGGG